MACGNLGNEKDTVESLRGGYGGACSVEKAP